MLGNATRNGLSRLIQASNSECVRDQDPSLIPYRHSTGSLEQKKAPEEGSGPTIINHEASRSLPVVCGCPYFVGSHFCWNDASPVFSEAQVLGSGPAPRLGSATPEQSHP